MGPGTPAAAASTPTRNSLPGRVYTARLASLGPRLRPQVPEEAAFPSPTPTPTSSPGKVKNRTKCPNTAGAPGRAEPGRGPGPRRPHSGRRAPSLRPQEIPAGSLDSTEGALEGLGLPPRGAPAKCRAYRACSGLIWEVAAHSQRLGPAPSASNPRQALGPLRPRAPALSRFLGSSAPGVPHLGRPRPPRRALSLPAGRVLAGVGADRDGRQEFEKGPFSEPALGPYGEVGTCQRGCRVARDRG